MSTPRPNGAAPVWPTDALRLGMRPFREFTGVATCSKCGLQSWSPRFAAQWHPDAVAPDCPPFEHLHVVCPACGHPTYYQPADAEEPLPRLADYWLS